MLNLFLWLKDVQVGGVAVRGSAGFESASNAGKQRGRHGSQKAKAKAKGKATIPKISLTNIARGTLAAQQS